MLYTFFIFVIVVVVGQGVWVEWDVDAHQNIYRYGFRGRFDILVLDEQRELGPGQDLAVGCLVRPGKLPKCVLTVRMFRGQHYKEILQWV